MYSENLQWKKHVLLKSQIFMLMSALKGGSMSTWESRYGFAAHYNLDIRKPLLEARFGTPIGRTDYEWTE